MANGLANCDAASTASACPAQFGEPRIVRGSILVVDNDPCVRELLSIHLSNAGYPVRTAEDAVAAGRLILESAPALMILDLEMPYITGYEFASLLKTDPRTRGIPVVFLSAKDNIAEQASKIGAVAYLRKPAIADKLLDLVALYIG